MQNKRHTKFRVPAKGLTLVELLMTVAVLAILLPLATIGMQSYMRNSRMVSQTNEVVGTLQVARTEAVKRSGHVYVCGSTNQTACNTSSWHSGWIVFFDPEQNAVDGGGAFVGTPPNGSDVILRVGAGFNGGTTLRSLNFAANNYVRYTSTGRINSTGSFVICNDEKNTQRARAINIGLTGLVTLAIDTDGTPDGVVNLPGGANVTCP